MQNIDSPLTQTPEVAVKALDIVADEDKSQLSTNYNVVRRNGKLTGFDKNKIAVAMTKAFLAVEGGQAAASTRVHETVEILTDMVVETLTRRQPGSGTFHIEDIQDQVELAMMRNGDQKIARAYVLYREQRANARAQERIDEPEIEDSVEILGLNIKQQDGSTTPLDTVRLKTIIEESCVGMESTSADRIYSETMKNLFDGVPAKDVGPTLVMSARGLIDHEPEYSNVAARLLLDELRTESLTFIDDGAATATYDEMAQRYPDYFQHYIKKATELELLDKELLKYDLKKLGKELDANRDHQFTYLGLQTLYTL
jgi:ribonucleoside-diphosphate reductase alpha chain